MIFLNNWILQELRKERLRKLDALSEGELKALWDQYDGCNAPGGYEGEDIHLALNLKGLGSYCAV